MGMDLNILPQYGENADFAHDIISLDRDYDLFDIIQGVEAENGRDVPRNGIATYLCSDDAFEERHYGKTTVTPYGDIIKGVQAGKLKAAVQHYVTESWRNKATIAYIMELPDTLEVYLFWC